MTQRRARPDRRLAHLAALLLLTSATATIAATAVATHGELAVKTNRIVDKQGQPVSLAGASLFWSNNGWGGDRFYDAATVTFVQQDWNASVIRTAMGVEAPGGYISDPAGNTTKVIAVADAAIANGMYVIIDWHSHLAHEHEAAAIGFFEAMAKRYGATPNVIYEIYNEPLDTDWTTTIKPYAARVIAAIRAIDPDNLVVVGTPSWSRNVDEAAADPLREQVNVAYALHFHAGSDGRSLRQRAQQALDSGIALFVTEWGAANAQGEGRVAAREARHWMEFLRKNQLSHCNWALNDNPQGASALLPGTAAAGPWPESVLTPSGKLAKQIIKSWDTRDYDGAP